MKLVASILVLYFGMLMVQPFAHMGSSAQSKPGKCHARGMCCRERAKHQGKAPAPSQNTACNRDFCNPFVPCGVSLAYRIPLPNLSSPVYVLSKKLKPATDENIISNYLSDCWRPPELLS
ncbi:MAG TPA: hypothetical protein VHC47_03220 [Mucilaginibacter sp.]|nr:hypothetical protein [Mucilaginibacter sp.]